MTTGEQFAEWMRAQLNLPAEQNEATVEEIPPNYPIVQDGGAVVMPPHKGSTKDQFAEWISNNF